MLEIKLIDNHTLLEMKNSWNLTLSLISIFASYSAGDNAAIAIDTQFGVAAPNCVEQSQHAINRCAIHWAKTAEFLRTLIYQDLDDRVSSSIQIQLNASERTWKSYRDLHCQESSTPFQDASMHPLIYNNCLASLTNDRIADLQGVGETTLTPTAIDRHLQSRLTQANLQNAPSQIQWQRYQQQHCQWASQYFVKHLSPHKCQQYLATSRIRHINKTIDIR